MNKIAWLAVPVFLAAPMAADATLDVVQTALNNSYALEAKHNIPDAINAIKGAKGVGQEDEYLLNYRLGWLSYLAGAYNESAAYYEQAASIEPSSVEPLLAMIQPLAAQTGKTNAIIAVHERVLKNDPNNYKSLSQLAWLNYSALKDHRKAAMYYERVLKLYPTNVEMMIGLGYSLKLGGNNKGAAKVFNQVLRLDPINARALDGLK